MSRDILDVIDNALDDCSVSGDAMRWTPDGPADHMAPWVEYQMTDWVERIVQIFNVPDYFIRCDWLARPTTIQVRRID